MAPDSHLIMTMTSSAPKNSGSRYMNQHSPTAAVILYSVASTLSNEFANRRTSLQVNERTSVAARLLTMCQLSVHCVW